MKGLLRKAVVAAIVVSAGTAAFAIAETTRYPSAGRIPTVVTSPSVTVSLSGAPQTSVATSTLRATVTPDLKPASIGENDGAPVTPRTAIPEKSTTTPETSAKKSDGGNEAAREVVTHGVREDGDGLSSANPEENNAESKKAPSDSANSSSKESSQEH